MFVCLVNAFVCVCVCVNVGVGVWARACAECARGCVYPHGRVLVWVLLCVCVGGHTNTDLDVVAHAVDVGRTTKV